jgi:toxin FitB
VIILDTNVLSEALRPAPSETVRRWQATHQPSTLFITAITQAEILVGIEAMPAGKRRQRLSEAVEQIFARDFSGRILPFDREAARHFAVVSAIRKAAGRRISEFDAMIAAITRAHRATLATRNVGDFEHCEIRLANPWTDVH